MKQKYWIGESVYAKVYTIEGATNDNWEKCIVQAVNFDEADCPIYHITFLSGMLKNCDFIRSDRQLVPFILDLSELASI